MAAGQQAREPWANDLLEASLQAALEPAQTPVVKLHAPIASGSFETPPHRSLEIAHDETMRRADQLGSGVGFLCAAHCAAGPLLFAAAPAFGLGWLVDERVEQSVVAVVCLIALFSAAQHLRSGRAYWLSVAMCTLCGVLFLGLIGVIPESAHESLTLACAFGLAGLHLYASREPDRKIAIVVPSAVELEPRACGCPEPCGR